ncbi:hypothetical protein FEK35_02715 [Nocardia cyriacigeorgica]|uniref:Uncharacterized protein n=1 Tax=Nocardia cyriacigeorgica TaxID=135487 RepID=A0A5R8PN04_9NOCA|nr:hypothetical protein FEK35_02715 [Nocardia cyriacigeorgica]
MHIDELETAPEWAAYYRQQFHLPAVDRGGYVMLPVTNSLGIVHMPASLADRVATLLRQQGCLGPVLARHIRRSFITFVDYSPGHQVVEALTRNDVCVPVLGSALMLPTGLGRWTKEGAYWVEPPHRDRLLPSLSTVVTTALAATSRIPTSGQRRRVL